MTTGKGKFADYAYSGFLNLVGGHPVSVGGGAFGFMDNVFNAKYFSFLYMGDDYSKQRSKGEERVTLNDFQELREAATKKLGKLGVYEGDALDPIQSLAIVCNCIVVSIRCMWNHRLQKMIPYWVELFIRKKRFHTEWNHVRQQWSHAEWNRLSQKAIPYWVESLFAEKWFHAVASKFKRACHVALFGSSEGSVSISLKNWAVVPERSGGVKYEAILLDTGGVCLKKGPLKRDRSCWVSGGFKWGAMVCKQRFQGKPFQSKWNHRSPTVIPCWKIQWNHCLEIVKLNCFHKERWLANNDSTVNPFSLSGIVVCQKWFHVGAS